DGLVVASSLDDVRVGGLAGGEDLPTDVHEGLDVRGRLALVFRLDVEDTAVVLDVGVVSGDHGEEIVTGAGRMWNGEWRTRNTERRRVPPCAFRPTPFACCP